MREPKASDDFIDRAVRFVVTEGRTFAAKAGNFLFGDRRRKIIATAVAAVLVIGSVGAGVGINYANEQAEIAAAHVAAVAAAKEKAEAEAWAKTVAEEQARIDLADAISDAKELSERAVKAAADSATWADPEVLTKLEAARVAMEAVLDAKTASDITGTFADVRIGLDSIGTLEDSQDRRYLAALAADGRTASSPDYITRAARKTCVDLDIKWAADPLGATVTISDHRSSFDGRVIEVYCPQYLPAVDAARYLVQEGKYAVADEATPFGIGGRPTLAAGTYVIPRASDCYWARSNSAGDILDNDFIGNAPGQVSVTIYAGEGFETSGCPTWVRH